MQRNLLHLFSQGQTLNSNEKNDVLCDIQITSSEMAIVHECLVCIGTYTLLFYAFKWAIDKSRQRRVPVGLRPRLFEGDGRVGDV